MEYLKIKDDKDLKELEEFGFTSFDDVYFLDDDDCEACHCKIIINEFRYICFVFEEDVYGYNGYIYEVSTSLPNVLFDLIQAGFVEKTGER